jgi:hypothetical protein
MLCLTSASIEGTINSSKLLYINKTFSQVGGEFPHWSMGEINVLLIAKEIIACMTY